MHPLAHPFTGLRVTIHSYQAPDEVGIIVGVNGTDVDVMNEDTGRVTRAGLGICTFHDPEAVKAACEAARQAPMMMLAQALGGAEQGEG